VLIRHEVREFLDEAVVSSRNSPESGGILIGSYRGPHVEVIAWTGPGNRDRRGWVSFVRKDKSHQERAAKAWASTQGTQTYIGEWHSHPSGNAIPSGIDHRAWREISSTSSWSSVFVIVAPAEWAVFWTPSHSVGEPRRLCLFEAGVSGVVFG
jgi:integrative and conjugative element protein (TIGR02256 family)